MKAVRFHKTGGPEVLVYEDVPDPTPKDGEVLIKVEAAGLNFSDVMRRRGDDYPEPSPTPFILGVEVAGTVAAVGNGVTSIAVGTPVLATPGAGGYAQYISVPCGHGRTASAWYYCGTGGGRGGARTDRGPLAAQRRATGSR